MSALVRASAQQAASRDLATFEAWGAPLQAHQFAHRESTLRAHPWSAQAMSTWLWVDARGLALCSCETFILDSFFGGKRGRSYAVASVYTEPALRGQGHASRMLSALVALIHKADPLAHAVVLFSDVGEAIYRRCGFAPLPAFDVDLLPAEGDPWEAAEPLFERSSNPTTHDYPLPPIDPPRGERFALWPSAEQIGWHLARERFYAGVLKRRQLSNEGLATPRKRPPVCGARAGSSWLLWTADYKANKLRVLLSHGAERQHLEMLLLAARRAASFLDLTSVSLWEDGSPLPWLAEQLGAARSPRDGSLPMILPLRPGLLPEHWRLRPRALWV